MQLNKKFFFGIYKVEPSGEWFLELIQDSLGLSLSTLKFNALDTRISQLVFPLPGEMSGLRTIEC